MRGLLLEIRMLKAILVRVQKGRRRENVNPFGQYRYCREQNVGRNIYVKVLQVRSQVKIRKILLKMREKVIFAIK